MLYSQIGGLAYVFGTVYGFDITQTGLVYLTIVCVLYNAWGETESDRADSAAS